MEYRPATDLLQSLPTRTSYTANVARGPTPRSRRGRPYNSPAAPSDTGAMTVQRHRVAWLLRVNRLYGVEPRWLKIGSFASSFPGGAWRSQADSSKISRWETARLRVPYLAIRRYEELLELLPTHLTSIVDTLYWYVSPTGDGANELHGTRPIGHADLRHRVDELIERACSRQLVTGGEWEELTVLLAATPRQIELAQEFWASLAERLISETIISDRVWLPRFASFNRLLAHPVAAPIAVAASASLGRDPTGQIFGETVGALEGSRHPDASTHIVSQLTGPTNDQAFYGALLASVRKFRYGHFNPVQVGPVVTKLTELLYSGAYLDDTRLLAAELLRLAPRSDRNRDVDHLRRAMAADSKLYEVFQRGRIASDAVATLIVDRITTSLIAQMPHDAGGFEDRQLPVLVEEMLFSPNPDVRMYAAKLIGATPYGARLARVIIGQLSVEQIRSDHDLAEAMIYSLRFLGGRDSRPFVEQLILARGVPISVNAMGARVVGHLEGASEDDYWKRSLEYHATLWTRSRSDVNTLILARLVYALGIARNFGLLIQIRDNAALPGNVRAAARWWLGIPRYISQSALI